MTVHAASARIQIAVNVGGTPRQTHAASGKISLALTLDAVIRTTPRLLGVTALNSRKIRATFDQSMARDSLLVNRFNYALIPLAENTADVAVESVSPEETPHPSYVDISVTEMTDGKVYRLAVNSGSGAPQSRYNLPLNTTADTADFTGVGRAPQIAQVKSVGPNRVDVLFNEVMLDNDAIRDPARYVFDNGLTVTSVLEVAADTVKLATTTQVAGTLYTLTIL